MPSPRLRPRFNPILTSLQLVAVLFTVSGLLSALSMAIGLLQGHLFMHPGVVGLWIAPGLRRLSRGWRVVALGYLLTAWVSIPFWAGWTLFDPATQVGIQFLGPGVLLIPRWLKLELDLLLVLIMMWQIRVLTHPTICHIFRQSRRRRVS